MTGHDSARIGTLLQELRRKARLSQAALAERTNGVAGATLTRWDISRYEREIRIPDVHLPALATALGTDLRRLESACEVSRAARRGVRLVDPGTPGSSKVLPLATDAVADDAEWKRNTEVLGVKAGGLPGETEDATARPEDEANALLQRFHSAQAVDPELAALLARETDAIRVIDRRLGAAAARRKLEAHIEQVEDVLRYSIRSHIRVALAGTVAESHTLAGWQSIDSGSPTLAWRHFEQAKAAAREADDATLLAHATGEQAYVLSDLQLADDALELVSSAYTDEVPVRLRIWLSMAKAEIAACAGEERTCRDALAAAERLLAHAEDDPVLPFVFVDVPHLRRWRANCLVRFEDPEAAEDLQAALEGLTPGTFNRAEAGLRCDMASFLLAQGERDEAQRHVDQAARLAEMTGSVRQRRRIADVSARLAEIG